MDPWKGSTRAVGDLLGTMSLMVDGRQSKRMMSIEHVYIAVYSLHLGNTVAMQCLRNDTNGCVRSAIYLIVARLSYRIAIIVSYRDTIIAIYRDYRDTIIGIAIF